MKKIKKYIIRSITIIAGFYLISEIEEITIPTIAFKGLSMLWIYLYCKANNFIK